MNSHNIESFSREYELPVDVPEEGQSAIFSRMEKIYTKPGMKG